MKKLKVILDAHHRYDWYQHFGRFVCRDCGITAVSAAATIDNYSEIGCVTR